MLKTITLFTLSALLSATAYGRKPMVKKGLGSRKQPVTLAMVPSTESNKILANMAPVARCLEAETGYYIDITVPNNYIVVVEGLGAKRVDVALLNTFGYLLANERYGAKALLKTSRYGHTTYKGQLLVRNNSKIKAIKDIIGKKVAYVDPASTSGYILAKAMLDKEKVRPAEEVFAGKHDVVVTMVYQGQVDAGATYYSEPRPDGTLGDARARVMAQFPDVAKKVKILAFTEEIPNDPVVARKGLPAPMYGSLKAAFKTCIVKHKKMFKGINNADAYADVKDSEYDGLRKTVAGLKIDLGSMLKKKK